MKILAIDTVNQGVTMEQIAPHLKEEAKMAWNLYKRGIFRELYFKGDKPGAVIILEAENVEAAKKIMDKLPLVKNKLIEFQYIPLDPFVPFEGLFAKE